MSSLGLDPQVLQRYVGEVEEVERANNNNNSSSHSSNSGSSSSSSNNSNNNNSNSSSSSSNNSNSKGGTIPVREMWTLLAQESLRLGQVGEKASLFTQSIYYLLLV